MRWAIPVVALALLVPLRHYGLEPSPERAEERQTVDYSRMRATGAFATYIGTVFLGSFRSLAVSFLWANYLEAKDDKRFYEAVEYGELIKLLQPRNVEVYASLGHDMVRNVPAMVRDEDGKWTWIRRGMLVFREAVDANPNDPYAYQQLAFWALQQRYATTEGELERWLINRYVVDEDLRRRMELDPDRLAERRGPFAASADWYARARDMSAEMIRQGRNPESPISLHPLHLEPFIVIGDFLEGVWLWQEGRHEDAVAAFERAVRRGEEAMAEYAGDWAELRMQQRRLDFYRTLPDVVRRARRYGLAMNDVRSRAIEEAAFGAAVRATPLTPGGLLRDVERLLYLYPGLDAGFLADLASEAMKAFSRPFRPWDDVLGRWRADDFEWNGHPDYAQFLNPRQHWSRPLAATLLPEGYDEDWYEIYIDLTRPAEDVGPPRPPLTLTVGTTRATRIHVSLFQRNERSQPVRIECFSVEPGTEAYTRVFPRLETGSYLLLFEPAGERQDTTDPPLYNFQVDVAP